MATKYIVLRELDHGGDEQELWTPIRTEVGGLEASSAKQAIMLAAADHGEGSYVAVPARSFKVLKATAVSRPSFKVTA